MRILSFAVPIGGRALPILLIPVRFDSFSKMRWEINEISYGEWNIYVNRRPLWKLGPGVYENVLVHKIYAYVSNLPAKDEKSRLNRY